MPDQPSPPPELPPEVVSPLETWSADQLCDLAEYANELAAYRERTDDEDTDAEDPERADDHAEDRPGGVPSKATLTTKEINGNRYHYWQWRDGDKIRSKYKGPAGDAE